MTNTLNTPQCYIKVDGSYLAATLLGALESAVVESTLHMPSMAVLCFHDPAMTLIDSNTISPGADLVVEINLQSSTEIFNGEVVAVEPDFSDGTSRLVIRAFDRMHRLSRTRRVFSCVNVKDTDVVKQLASNNGLRYSGATSSEVHPALLQANQTDLEFAQSRLALLGLLMRANGKQLIVEQPNEKDVANLAWNEGLREFRPRLTASARFSEVKVRSWDSNTEKALVSQKVSSESAASIGEARTFSTEFGGKAIEVISDCRLTTQAQTDALAQAQLNRLNSQVVEAEGSSLGDPKIVAGTTLKISGVGTKYSGKYLVTSATHRFGAGRSYTTDFSLTSGQNASVLSALAPATAPTLGSGLMIGIVTDNNDPKKQGRVKLKLPWLSEEHTPDWARVASPGAGATRGLHFTPEINDEVVVGFEQGDLNRPFVIGGLWNGKDAPPVAASEAVKNGAVVQRALISRSGHKIILDDTQGSEKITVVVKNGSKLELKLAGSALEITSDSATTLKVTGNLDLESTGNIALKSTGDIALDAGGNLSLKAKVNISAEATVKAGIKGNAGVDVTSTGITNVKGSLINLN